METKVIEKGNFGKHPTNTNADLAKLFLVLAPRVGWPESEAKAVAHLIRRLRRSIKECFKGYQGEESGFLDARGFDWQIKYILWTIMLYNGDMNLAFRTLEAESEKWGEKGLTVGSNEDLSAVYLRLALAYSVSDFSLFGWWPGFNGVMQVVTKIYNYDKNIVGIHKAIKKSPDIRTFLREKVGVDGEAVHILYLILTKGEKAAREDLHKEKEKFDLAKMEVAHEAWLNQNRLS